MSFIKCTSKLFSITFLPLDWHEEECLVKNPFYYELPLDCWPCEDIRTLVDLTGFRNFSDDYVYNEKPFIVRVSKVYLYMKFVLTP